MHVLNLIGFTGTIASGKSIRCRHLLKYAATKYNIHRIEPTSYEKKLLSSSPTTSEEQELLLPYHEKEKNSTSSRESNNMEWAELLHKKIELKYVSIKSTNVSILHINADKVAHNIYAPGEPSYYELINAFGDRILDNSPTQQEQSCKEQENTNILTVSSNVQNNNNNISSEYSVEEQSECRQRKHQLRTLKEEAEVEVMPKINRHVLGEIVFADKNALETLNRICRPAVAKKVRQMIIDAYCTTLQHGMKKESNARERQIEQEQPVKENGEVIALIILLEAALLIEAENFVSVCDEVWITHCDRDEAVSRVMKRDLLSYNDALQRLQSQLNLEGKLAQLQNLHFDKPVRVIDTSHLKVADGLREVEIVFDDF